LTRGYFGIGIYHPKREENIGSLWRTAHSFGANFIFTIGPRYKRQASDTSNATAHVPLFEYSSWEEFKASVPGKIICVELDDKAISLRDFIHPQQATYVLGAEDHGIPEKYLGDTIVKVNGGEYCLNVAVAGSIVIYDRVSKYGKSI
jgi:tRNA(Leu) C34 or U34 (ribose-2'-O)-methylase TrmL